MYIYFHDFLGLSNNNIPTILVFKKCPHLIVFHTQMRCEYVWNSNIPAKTVPVSTGALPSLSHPPLLSPQYCYSEYYSNSREPISFINILLSSFSLIWLKVFPLNSIKQLFFLVCLKDKALMTQIKICILLVYDFCEKSR